MDIRQIRVMIVEDEKFVRKLISQTLERDKKLKVSIVAETDNGMEAIQLASKHETDVIIMDINIRELNGIDATRRILEQNPRIKVIALTVLSSKTAIIEMLRAGAMGFVPKDGSYDELLKAISAVMENEYFFGRDITTVMRDYFMNSQESTGDGFLSLARDDMAIVRLSADGRSLKEIADFLDVSPGSIAKRRERIKNKLQVANLTELISYANREGIINSQHADQ